MPIELPNLDDRSFADLLDEGRNMIPALAPTWTDHNPSDPGITLLEMFAAVTEQLIYRTNRITNAHKNVFLRLIEPPRNINGHSNLVDDLPPSQIDDALAQAIQQMRVEERAITAADYERLACSAGAVRARCLPRSKAVYKDDRLVAVLPEPGHLTLIVAGGQETFSRYRFAPALKHTALTTTAPLFGENAPPTLHIVQAQPLLAILTVTLACQEEYRIHAMQMVAPQVRKTLRVYFDIKMGGPAQQGWPLGQAIYKSTLYALISQIMGVDYIVTLELSVDAERLAPEGNGIIPACYEYIDLDVVCVFLSEPGE